MAVATFDTLKFANTLKASGVPEKQAEAQAVAFAEVIQINFKDLVTKDDLAVALKTLETKMDSQIDLLKAEFRSLRSELKSEIMHLKWMVGVGISIGIAILVRLFFFHSPL